MKDHWGPEEDGGDAGGTGMIVGARLKVTHRDEGGYLARPIHVALDGRELTVLKSGKEYVREIELGRHRLRFDNTFWPKTVEFDVAAGDHIHFAVRNKKGFGSWMIEMMGAGPVYLAVERV